MSKSDVRIVTSKKGFEELKLFVNNYIKENSLDEDVKNLLDEVDLKYENSKQCYFGWNNKNWNEYSYKSVKAIMKGLHYLEDNNYSFNYYRLGEEKEDYDEHCNYSDKEGFLEEPNIIRKFDDKYVCDIIYTQKLNESKECIDYE